MANELKLGDLSFTLPDDLEIPERAYNESLEQLGKTSNARRGVGVICMMVADLMERYPGRLRLDPKYTPEYLRALGEAAEAWDRVLLNLEEAKRLVQKSNLIADGDAHSALGDVNKQLKSQSADDPALSADFAALRAYFGAKA